MKTSHVLLPLVLATALTACGGGSGKDKPKPVPVNTPPVATGATLTTQTDTQLSGTLMGTDANGDALTYMVAAQPTQGVLAVQANGSFTYMPNSTVTGTDQFTFTVSDGKAASTAAAVNITIETLQLSFSDYSREAFEQMPTDEPLPINGREFQQDVSDPTAYDDLLQ